MRNAQKRYVLRKLKVRKKIFGTAVRPRLSVYRSLRNIHAQVIDDMQGKVIAADSTISAESKDRKKGGNIVAAEKVGDRIAKKTIAAGIKKVVFDRGGVPYHGRIKALAESARKAGLEF